MMLTGCREARSHHFVRIAESNALCIEPITCPIPQEVQANSVAAALCAYGSFGKCAISFPPTLRTQCVSRQCRRGCRTMRRTAMMPP